MHNNSHSKETHCCHDTSLAVSIALHPHAWLHHASQCVNHRKAHVHSCLAPLNIFKVVRLERDAYDTTTSRHV